MRELSVIVPVFNKGPYLRKCISSISNQIFADIEIICIDDASTDESPQILSEIAAKDKRIRIYRNAANLGPGPARNIGIEHARAAYVQFTDADDLLPPNALNALYQLAKQTGSAVVRGSLAVFPEGPSKSWFETYCPGMAMPDRRNFHFTQDPLLSVPWFHTTYLFLRRFLQEHSIRYPDLDDGEDPVFVASVLTKTENVSTTAETVYLYRKDRLYDRATPSIHSTS